MSDMGDPMTLVPSPNTWADRICDMQGFDYERVRDASSTELILDPTLQDSDAYAHWYIGDYVTLLSDFVESYRLDHPFTDERDVAVVSVRDDLMRATKTCEVPSINLLYFSEDIGKHQPVEDADLGVSLQVGWQAKGCLDEGTLSGCDPDAGTASARTGAWRWCATTRNRSTARPTSAMNGSRPRRRRTWPTG